MTKTNRTSFRVEHDLRRRAKALIPVLSHEGRTATVTDVVRAAINRGLDRLEEAARPSHGDEVARALELEEQFESPVAVEVMIRAILRRQRRGSAGKRPLLFKEIPAKRRKRRPGGVG